MYEYLNNFFQSKPPNRKYTYSINVPIFGKKGFVLCHNIFLTKEQREALLRDDVAVIVEGRCVVASLDFSRAEEERQVNYAIIKKKSEKPIDDCKIYLNKKQVESLQDVQKGGCMFCTFNFHDVISIDGKEMPVLHQFIIEDSSIFNESKFDIHRSQIGFKQGTKENKTSI